MKTKIEGCLSFIVIVTIIAICLFITYLFALGIVTFVDKVGEKVRDKIVVVDTVKCVDTVRVIHNFEDLWDKNIPLTDSAI